MSMTCLQAISMSCECDFTDSSHLTTSCGSSANITLFMSLVDLMVRSRCSVADPCRRAPNVTTTPDEFDFIVVGGGVAGKYGQPPTMCLNFVYFDVLETKCGVDV